MAPLLPPATEQAVEWPITDSLHTGYHPRSWERLPEELVDGVS
jgi:hypothetical protein